MATKKNDYQSLTNELNEVLETLQSDELDIEKAVVSYERGMQLIELIEAQLKTAENKVTAIKKQWDKTS